MGSKKKVGSRKKAKRSSKIKGMKRCPDCKVKGVCKTCDGHGETRCVQGRNKGSKFERDIAKGVSDWTGYEFKRTPMSGGWAKTGDITPKDPIGMVYFPFSIECKNQVGFSASALMDCAGYDINKTIQSWWKQCVDDSMKSKKIPLLVMTTIREPVFVMMWSSMFKYLKMMKYSNFVLRTQVHGMGLRVMLWNDFLEKPYEEMTQRLDRKNKKAIALFGKRHG